jgi:2-methylisocitrate lyase-like PEP mutase family enzyme
VKDRQKLFRRFFELHRPGDPLILFNVWDAGSARAVVEAGAQAIATGSWSVAAAHAYADGEALPLDLALANAERIARAVDLPVTVDFEGGYAPGPEAVGDNAARLAATDVIGCNIEDRVVGGDGLYPLRDQADRIEAMRQGAGSAFFINARTDIFLKAPPEEHRDHFRHALERAHAYAEAGANGFFIPGVVDRDLIARICEASPLPVNVMVWPGTPPLRELALTGAARISHAGAPWRLAMQALGEAARRAHQGEG